MFSLLSTRKPITQLISLLVVPNLALGYVHCSRTVRDVNPPLLTTADGSNLTENRISWFDGGVANVTETCVDKHLGKNKIALIWEKDEPGTQEYVTYEVQ